MQFPTVFADLGSRITTQTKMNKLILISQAHY
jgi:hypothetical protein